MKTVKLILLTMLLSLASFAQTEYVSLVAKNITRVDTNSVTFDLYAVKIGGDSLKVSYYDVTIGFDLHNITNGGMLTVGYTDASSDTTVLAVSQRTPTVTYDSANGEIRIVCTKVTAVKNTKGKLATSTGTKLAKISIDCSNPFVVGSHLNLEFIKARMVVFVNTATSGIDVLLPWRKYVLVNTALN